MKLNILNWEYTFDKSNNIVELSGDTDENIKHIIKRIYVTIPFMEDSIEVYSDIEVQTEKVVPKSIKDIDFSTTTSKLIVTSEPEVLDTNKDKANTYIVYVRLQGKPRYYGVQQFIAENYSTDNILEYTTKPNNLTHKTLGNVNSYTIKAN